MDDFHSSTTGMELWERSHGAFFKALVSSASLPVSAWSERYNVTKCQKSQIRCKVGPIHKLAIKTSMYFDVL